MYCSGEDAKKDEMQIEEADTIRTKFEWSHQMFGWLLGMSLWGVRVGSVSKKYLFLTIYSFPHLFWIPKSKYQLLTWWFLAAQPIGVSLARPRLKIQCKLNRGANLKRSLNQTTMTETKKLGWRVFSKGDDLDRIFLRNALIYPRPIGDSPPSNNTLHYAADDGLDMARLCLVQTTFEHNVLHLWG